MGTGLTNPTPNSSRLTVILKPIGQRPPLPKVEAQIHRSIRQIAGLHVFMQPVQDITLSSRISPTQYQYTLVDTSRTRVEAFAHRLVHHLRDNTLLRDVATDSQGHGLETRITVDRTRAAELGVSMQTIENTLYDAFGQRQISTIYAQNNQYRVILSVQRQFRRQPSDLASLYVPSTQGAEVPLYELAHVSQRRTALAINQENQFPAVTISFNLAPHASLGAAEQAILGTQSQLHKPRSISGTFTGAAAQLQSALAHEPWLIAATLIVIYIVLGILYESVIHPLTILSTLPSAGVGALATLVITGSEFTIVALVGIVLLMGIVKKNGIMMVDFAIEAQRRGVAAEEAIIEASVLRFRPILMTTLAALFGAVPLILEGGAGAELRIPLGITIIGGLLVSQLLTLFTTPVIYLTLDRIRRPHRLQIAPTIRE
jgi:multidrug efflux pump